MQEYYIFSRVTDLVFHNISNFRQKTKEYLSLPISIIITLNFLLELIYENNNNELV